jgi:adenylosuccinate lyase
MTIATLKAISPLEGRYADKLGLLRDLVSEYGLMKFRVLVEIRWLQLLASDAKLPELAPLDAGATKTLNEIAANFSETDAQRIKDIERTINHDVKAVEYFIKEKLTAHSNLEKISEFIHFGCTSEDINNLAYGLMLLTTRDTVILPALDEIIGILSKLAHANSKLAMLSRTHGQPATPTTVGKEMANVVARLQRQRLQLRNASLLGKLNGASGNYNALVVTYPKVNWAGLSKKLVTSLGLDWNDYTTQIEPHDYMAELFANMQRINTILIDFTRDMWGYISLNYFQQKKLENEVGSSTMPHKINPIDFENAEGNLGIANALFAHFSAKLPVSRWQRDLSDSTVLRNIGVAFAHSLLSYQATCKGLHKTIPNTEIISADLNAHWEILGEAIQTVMRRYGIEQPYEKLKTFTRGKIITQPLLQQFIEELSLPDTVKKELQQLTPENYLGNACDLANKI